MSTSSGDARHRACFGMYRVARELGAWLRVGSYAARPGTPPKLTFDPSNLGSLSEDQLYSLDVFLSFVNLHQEHYWWPDADAEGEWTIVGQRVKISGRLLRYYF